ncbi:MAG TPA: carboxypeptidase regulatory-like domain-containing protein [Pyrinomonadaceae bacterium]|jgi:uncharacterized delta-60 repeat protein|nr:carboxypeptidase regulatory-like domain-containing protein [Pyrinomonadaceae bacterium]
MKLKVLILLAGSFIASSAFAAPGDLDPTFNGSGIKFTNFSTFNSITFPTNILAVQADGKILAGASTNCPGVGACISIFRFNPNGSADTTFGIAGRADLSSSVSGVSEIFGITLQQDGKILATARAMNASQTKFIGALVRLNVNGSLDQTFGGSGIVKNDMTYDVYSTSVAVQPDGKILSGGYVVYSSAQTGTRYAWAVARNNADGSLDTSFNQSGTLILDPTNAGYSLLKSIMAQPDGKIILAGHSIDTATPNTAAFALVRLSSDGTRDTGFGSNGIVLISMPSTTQFMVDAALQPDGKVVMMGMRGGTNLVLARVDENGQPDASFGANGVALYPGRVVNGNAPGSILPLADGRFFVGGAGMNGAADFAVARYNSDGSIDAPLNVFGKRESVLGSFWGSGGTAVAAGTSGWDHSMVLDAAGRVLVAGKTSPTNTLALARFQSDASPYASISGTVRTAGGLPIRNAYVTLSGGSLSEPVTALTNNLGIYQFTNLPVTETYTVTATAKRFRFAAGERVVMLNAETENFDFSANQ